MITLGDVFNAWKQKKNHRTDRMKAEKAAGTQKKEDQRIEDCRVIGGTETFAHNSQQSNRKRI